MSSEYEGWCRPVAVVSQLIDQVASFLLRVLVVDLSGRLMAVQLLDFFLLFRLFFFFISLFIFSFSLLLSCIFSSLRASFLLVSFFVFINVCFLWPLRGQSLTWKSISQLVVSKSSQEERTHGKQDADRHRLKNPSSRPVRSSRTL